VKASVSPTAKFRYRKLALPSWTHNAFCWHVAVNRFIEANPPSNRAWSPHSRPNDACILNFRPNDGSSPRMESLRRGSDLKGLAGLVRPNDASKPGKRRFKSQNFSDAVFETRFEIVGDRKPFSARSEAEARSAQGAEESPEAVPDQRQKRMIQGDSRIAATGSEAGPSHGIEELGRRLVIGHLPGEPAGDDGTGTSAPTRIVFPLERSRSTVCCQNSSVAGVQVNQKTQAHA
jgi:hypothetical protein